MSANPEYLNRNKPGEMCARPAELGDVCVLLEPTYQDEITWLHEQQTSLQSRFRGRLVKNVHLTCQRFRPNHGNSIESLVEGLEHAVVTIEPFPLTALSLQTLYVPVLRTNTLKWEIRMTGDLRRFVTLVEQTLVSSDIVPLYNSGFVSSLVAALKDVPEPSSDSLSNYPALPHHLFTAGQMALSRIVGPTEFEILASIPLARSSIRPWNCRNASFGLPGQLCWSC
jgi:hypothetical protein